MGGRIHLAGTPVLEWTIVIEDILTRAVGLFDSWVSSQHGDHERFYVGRAVHGLVCAQLTSRMQLMTVQGGGLLALPGRAANVCQPCGPSNGRAQFQNQQGGGLLDVQQDFIFHG